ncbi:MAG: ABC transporter permease subunit [Candidatus Eisenbacteria bacterium]|uniref:ABC transporter permease subunit n=1 Tax=Eiseniibacteriota bacterium TaxID=2212470 RepID=A0A948W822_UNCEI|nr:ABC transporter permease subunit [Candidatus Eisenbacteria bacterium]MBU1948353.1 ABC transporter permease subunit [Candidatus Eisenbacteria bacterium]MBU2692246.1 ABC transporter permease subunit [Candidatus Eisenbacteria bacterium]
MSDQNRAPSSFQVVRAIAQREFNIGLRSKLIKLLFLASTLPPLVLTIILIVRTIAKQSTGFDLGWDPMLWFLRFQTLPIALLALRLGTPSVARDRAEEVLFLYATRPVHPWHYALGKMLAVAIPAAALLLFPGILIGIFRLGITADYTTAQALVLIAKLFVASLVLAWCFAGVSVGPSAAVRRTRWAFLIALGCYLLPDALSDILSLNNQIALGPADGIRLLLEHLFNGGRHAVLYTMANAGVLAAWGSLGMLAAALRVRQEMIP